MITFYIIFSIFIFLLGLSIGSFINALVYRLHNKESMWARSHCPSCNHQLSISDLIPLFSYLFLKRKCRYCKEKISWQYPLVEFVTSIIFILLFFKFLLENSLISSNFIDMADVSSLFIYSIILIAIFVYDFKYYIIPNKILFAGILLGIIILLFKTLYLWTSEFLIIHSVSILIVFGFFLFLYLVSHGKWIGAGDVKFGILLGLIFSWDQSLVMLFFSYVLGAIIGIYLIISKRKKLKEKVPMGTFLVIGSFITIFIGKYILNWYLNLIL